MSSAAIPVALVKTVSAVKIPPASANISAVTVTSASATSETKSVCQGVDTINTINILAASGKKTHDYFLSCLDDGVWPTRNRTNTIAGTLSEKNSPTIHGLVQTVHHSFANETDLTLRPDDLQLAIVQVVAQHVFSNPDKYRSKLGVTFDAKQTIIVEQNQLNTSDSIEVATPKWSTVFPVFEKEIKSRLTDTAILRSVLTQFSTTTKNDQLIRQVALMDVVQSYFDFVVRTRCGIPAIHLKGTVADWQLLYDSLSAYDALDLGWWTKPLKAVLSHFIKSFDKSKPIDLTFWKSIYKYESRSGGGFADGWIQLFTPIVLNSKCVTDEKEWSTHKYTNNLVCEPSDYGSGISQVPFVWNYLGTKIPMVFSAGYAKPNHDKLKNTTEPTVGWAVLTNKDDD